MNRTAAEIRRLLDIGDGVCAVCSFVADAMRQHVDKLFYERVTDIQTREAIRAAGGFCRRHARLVWAQADALGTALILHDILINQLRSMDAGQMDRPPRTVRGLGRLLEGGQRGKDPRSPCTLCEVEREMEALVVDDLLSALSDRSLREAYCHSRGLCVPHFRLAFEHCTDSATWELVLQTQRMGLTALADELKELARKQDHRFRDEAVGVEADSWRRALDVTSGKVQD